MNRSRAVPKPQQSRGISRLSLGAVIALLLALVSGGFTATTASAIDVISTSDTTAPVLQSLVVSPTSVDTTNSSASVSMTIHVTDDVSGYTRAFYVWSSPTGSQGFSGNIYPNVGGVVLDGTFTGTATFPRYGAVGNWSIIQFCLYDNAGNNRCYTKAQLQAAGFDSGVSVTGAPDTTAPVLQSLVVSPTSVDTTNSSASVSMTIHVTDDVSGYTRAFYVWSSPTGSQGFSGNIYPNVGGVVLDGTFTGTATFPKSSVQGDWSIIQFCLYDNAGNNRCYTKAQLQAAGFGSGVTIVSVSDTTAPSLLDLQVAPSSIDTSLSSASVSMTIHVTDDMSGFVRAFYVWSSPDSSQGFAGNIYPNVGGVVLDGTFTGTATFPRYSMEGDWSIIQFCVYDNVGNNRCFTKAQLDANNFDNGAHVTTDTTPPTVTISGVTAGATYAWNAAPTPVCNTTDSGSGVATNATLSVTHTGTSYIATCSGAVDNAGNTASDVSVNYTVQAQPSGTVVVMDSAGNPLAGVGVKIRNGAGTVVANTTTDANGVVNATLANGTYTTSVTYATGTVSKSLTITTGNQGSVTFQTVAVTAAVADSHGSPLTNGSVAQAGNSGAFNAKVPVNGNGQVTYEVLPGTNSFTAWFAGGYQTKTVTVPSSGPYTVNFNTVAVTVNISDPVTADITAATVTQAGKSGTFGPKTAVDGNGNVSFEVLSGTNSFTAWVAGGSQTKTVTVPDTGPYTVNFVTYPVTVQVYDAQGNPATSAQVTHAGSSGVFSPKTDVDGNGQVTFYCLPGTSTFTAWMGSSYRTGSLSVSGASDFALTFYVA